MDAPAAIDRHTLALLVQVARPMLRAENLPEIKRLAARLTPRDWERLADRALQTRTAPWVIAHLHALQLPAPPTVLAALDELAQAVLQRTLDCDQLRLHVAPLLQGPDAPTLLLKGRAIEARAYPPEVLRPTVDVDLLVRPGSLERVEKFLRRLGLRPHTSADKHVRGWGLPGARAGVDLHTYLLEPSRFPALARQPSALFSRAKVGPSGYLELDPLDQTAHLLAHLTTGLYADLRHLADAALWLEVVRPSPRKLAQVLSEWQALGSARAALLALRWFDPRGPANAVLDALGGPGWRAHGFAQVAKVHLRRVGTMHPRWLEAVGLMAHLDRPLAYLRRRLVADRQETLATRPRSAT